MIWLSIAMCYVVAIIAVAMCVGFGLRIQRLETDLFITKDHILKGLDTLNKTALDSQRIVKDVGNKITIAGGVSRN